MTRTPTIRRDYKSALQAIVDWQSHCLNFGNASPQTRSLPNDDDLCELFNRIDRARRVLGPGSEPR